MATRHQPNGPNTDTHDDGSAAFPENPKHLDQFDAPGGLTYIYKAKDDTGKDISGYWAMFGYPGPPGPEGPRGPGGLTGSYPTINYEKGTWDLAHQEYDDDGKLIDIKEPTDYPAQGVVRVLDVIGYIPKNPENYNLGDAYFVETYDANSDPIHSELYVIPHHNHRMHDGAVDNNRNKWVNMGIMGGTGTQGEQGEQGPKGEPGASFIRTVDYFPAGALYEEGEMLMELSTKTIFVAVNPAVKS